MIRNVKKLRTDSGFTLLELIVSLGLFIVVITISTSALLSLTDINRKVQSMRIAFDNLNLAVESMSKDIRMGTSYTCNPSLPISLSPGGAGVDCGVSIGISIAFFSQKGNVVVYRQIGTRIERSKNGGSSFVTITSPEVSVDNLSFGVYGALSGGDQPRVLVLIKGSAGMGDTKSDFNVQTSVTQRMPDL